MVGIACAALWVAAAVAVLFARGARSWAATAALALVAAAIVTSAVVVASPVREPPDLVAAAQKSRSVTLTIDVTGRAVDGRVAGATRSGVPILVFGEAADPVVAQSRVGDVLRVSGALERAEAGEDVAFLMFARDEVQLVARSAGLLGGAADLRERFRALAERLPGRGGGLLPGLAIGDTSAVEPGLDADMKTSSLSHLTAVSGSNCAVVVGLLFVLAAAFGMPRWGRIALAGAGLAGFVVLVTPEPSVVRAAAMAAIALGGLAVSRPGRGIPLLCVAVLVLLTLDPWLARSYGFALSVLATAGLLVLAGPIAAVFGQFLPRSLSLILAVPLAAQLACQPVLLLLTPALPVYGVVANVLAEPAAPIATVIGLVACLLATLAPPLALPVAWLAWMPSSWIAAVATFSAGLPGARSPWPTGALGVVLLIALSLAAIVLILGIGAPSFRRATGFVLAIAVVGYAGAVAGGRLMVEVGKPADWEFALCDVGQGDAAVIRSGGVIALIDTGPQAEPLARCLDQLGVDRIQLLVLTHYDLDHVGGVAAVVGRVDRVLVGPPSDAGDAAIAAALAGGGADVDRVSRGEHGTLGAVGWRVLWPPPRGVEPGNPASVTIEVIPGAGCGCLSGLFLGDLGEESQRRLLGTEPLTQIDVVKVAHHGSADQSAALYEAIRATVGLIGVGADNDYGHPTESLLGVLAAVGTAPRRSDLDGLILVAPGDRLGEVRVWTERGG
jgi:competence protein ComEC